MLQTRCVIVVGYAGNQLNGGYMITLVTPQFATCGNIKSVNLSDIRCSDDMIGLVTLNTLTEDGQLDVSYTWTADWMGNIGWIDPDTGLVAEGKTFAPGTAFWTQCDVDEGMGDISSSGEVSTDDVTTELNGGYMITLVGNSSPVAIDLNDVLCSDDMIGLVTLNTLTNDGQLDISYTYTADWMGNIGWIDPDTGLVAEGKMLDPGQAFWVQCDVEEGKGDITFPGVEL